MGVSVENDQYLDRIDLLRQTSAYIKFLSLEPLLGPLPNLRLEDIDWVIVGGESGPGARPMDPSWVKGIRDQCVVINLNVVERLSIPTQMDARIGVFARIS